MESGSGGSTEAFSRTQHGGQKMRLIQLEYISRMVGTQNAARNAMLSVVDQVVAFNTVRC